MTKLLKCLSIVVLGVFVLVLVRVRPTASTEGPAEDFPVDFPIGPEVEVSRPDLAIRESNGGTRGNAVDFEAGTVTGGPRGRVLHTDFSSAAGVNVQFVAGPETWVSASGEDGSLILPPAEVDQGIDLEVADPGFVGLNRPTWRGEPEGVVVFVAKKVAIDGAIFGQDGEPVIGGEVQIVLPPHMSTFETLVSPVNHAVIVSPQGEFNITEAPYEAGAYLRYEDGGRVYTKDLEEDELSGIDWFLAGKDISSETLLRGLVRLDSGSPVSGATVICQGHSLTTDEGGRFSVQIPNRDQVEQLKLFALKGGVGGGHYEVDLPQPDGSEHAGAEPDEIVLTLRELRMLPCRFQWSDGSPIPGAQVYLREGALRIPNYPPGMSLDALVGGVEVPSTNEEGVAVLRLLEGSTYRLRLTMDDLPLAVSLPNEIDEFSPGLITVPDGLLRGETTIQVVDQSDSPIAGSSVSVLMVPDSRAPYSRILQSKPVTTDQQGVCEIGRSPREGGVVSIQTPSGLHALRPLEAVAEDRFVVRLKPTCTLDLSWSMAHPPGSYFFVEDVGGDRGYLQVAGNEIWVDTQIPCHGTPRPIALLVDRESKRVGLVVPGASVRYQSIEWNKSADQEVRF